MGLCKYRGGKGPCPHGDSGLAEQLKLMHFVTGIEMSKAAVSIGGGTFLCVRGGVYEERIHFWRPHYPVE